jgi:hypothetical protein
MKKPESKIKTVLLLTIIISLVLITNIYSQSENKNNSFIAIFKDSLLMPNDTNIREIAINISETEIREMISRDSLIKQYTGKDSIWIFDFVVSGRRCYGTIFGGPVLSGIMKENISDNIIYLYSSSDVRNSRLFNGMFIFKSNDAGWKFEVKTED